MAINLMLVSNNFMACNVLWLLSSFLVALSTFLSSESWFIRRFFFFHTKLAQTSVNMNFKVMKVWRWQRYNNWKQQVCAATFEAFVSAFQILVQQVRTPFSLLFFPSIALHHLISSKLSHCVKWFFHTLFPDLILSFHSFFSQHKRRLKFLLMMPIKYFFLPQHAKANSICQHCFDINKKKLYLSSKIFPQAAT